MSSAIAPSHCRIYNSSQSQQNLCPQSSFCKQIFYATRSRALVNKFHFSRRFSTCTPFANIFCVNAFIICQHWQNWPFHNPELFISWKSMPVFAKIKTIKPKYGKNPKLPALMPKKWQDFHRQSPLAHAFTWKQLGRKQLNSDEYGANGQENAFAVWRQIILPTFHLPTIYHLLSHTQVGLTSFPVFTIS